MSGTARPSRDIRQLNSKFANFLYRFEPVSTVNKHEDVVRLKKSLVHVIDHLPWGTL